MRRGFSRSVSSRSGRTRRSGALSDSGLGIDAQLDRLPSASNFMYRKGATLMPPKKPSKTTQPAVSKGTKEKSAAPTGAQKPEPSAKAATMPPPVPSGKPDGSPAKSQTREDASPPDSLAQPPSSMRAAGPAEASAVDGPPSHSGIDALAVMKQAEVDKRAAKSGPCPEAKHI
jgi:hypothetical protein